MPIVLDKKTVSNPPHLSEQSTMGDALNWANTLLPEGRVIVKIEFDGKLLEGSSLSEAQRDRFGQSTLSLGTADRKELSLTMLGKLAALIQWLAPQHQQTAAMFERGETQKALVRLGELVSAWQQIQTAYANLAKLRNLSLKDIPVHELDGEAVLNEFCSQLAEIQTALQNQDFVLLADILQYEMDGAVVNWMALLEATLGIVEPVPV